VTVLEKKTDALLGGADDQYFLIKYKGGNPVAMRYADFGANIVGMTILDDRRHDQEKSRPREAVRARDREVVGGSEEESGAAVDAAMKAKPDLNRQSTLDQLMVDIDLMDSKNSKGRSRLGRAGRLGPDARDPQELRELATDKTWTTSTPTSSALTTK
jgi:NitT/TauT family transport system substrate-binding protein